MSSTPPNDLIGLISQPEYWQQTQPADKKRAFERFDVRGDATLEPIETGHVETPNVRVQLRDISRGGLGFVCDRFIEPGTVWRVRFEYQSELVGTQPLVVRFCRMTENGMYLAGGQFVLEPAVMVLLGVGEQNLTRDIVDRQNPLDTADFVAPDALEE